MKIYYMRDNHTFLPLPLNVGEAEDLLRQEFNNGYTYGMLCTKATDSLGVLHAYGNDSAEEFFNAARQWLQKAIEYNDHLSH